MTQTLGFFSVLDIISAIRNESSYQKTRNYWKYLKAKLKKENSQLVSATTQLKNNGGRRQKIFVRRLGC